MVAFEGHGMREDIIRIAREAGLIRAGENYTEPARWGISEITDFYNRVAAAERDRMCEQFNIPKELAHEKTTGNEAD